MKFFSDIRLLILAIWLGAAVFFIGVAQTAFVVLPDKELAGAFVGRNLMIVNFAGIGISVILLLTSLIGTAKIGTFWLWVERFLLLFVAAACAVGQFVIGVWLASIRGQMSKPLAEVAADDSLRLQFDVVHQYSTWVFLAGMIAALIAFFIISNRRFGLVKPEKAADPYDFSKEFKV